MKISGHDYSWHYYRNYHLSNIWRKRSFSMGTCKMSQLPSRFIKKLCSKDYCLLYKSIMNFRVVQTGFHLGYVVLKIMRKLDVRIAWRAHFFVVSLKFMGHRFPYLSGQVIKKSAWSSSPKIYTANTDFSYANQLLRLQETMKWAAREEVSSLVFLDYINPYPIAFPYGNGMVLHFYQQQESSTTKTVHKVINKGLKTYV